MGSVSELLNKKIGIIIPAFNPDVAQLTELVKRIRKTCKPFNYRLIIVDDGSKTWSDADPTLDNGVFLLKHPKNLGKGAALKTGFNYFLSDNRVDLVMTLDADLQHLPEKIPDFITAFIKNKWNIVVGYRQRDPKIMPFHRIISNTLTSLTISVLTGQLVRDSQCGFRLIETRVLNCLKLNENHFHLESELLIRASYFGFKIGFVKIPTIYANQKSSINNVTDTLNFIFLLMKIIKERVTGTCSNYKEK